MIGLLTFACVVYQVGTEAFTGGPATFTVDNFSADLQ